VVGRSYGDGKRRLADDWETRPMSCTPSETEPLYSDLSGDPDLAELVAMFVEEMPERVANLGGALEARDWERLGRFAHRLKGSAGSYGFPAVGRGAARVEDAIRSGLPEIQIKQAVDKLLALCRRARHGVPGSSAFLTGRGGGPQGVSDGFLTCKPGNAIGWHGHLARASAQHWRDASATQSSPGLPLLLVKTHQDRARS
jgi:HPt (histidine-containing phosphotransfer) domain-containing protein